MFIVGGALGALLKRSKRGQTQLEHLMHLTLAAKVRVLFGLGRGVAFRQTELMETFVSITATSAWQMVHTGFLQVV